MSSFNIGDKIPKDLANASVIDENSNNLKLATFWKEGPALILFIRHFGCFGCATQMQAIAPRIQEIDALNIRIYLVGNGNPNFIEGFKERFQLYNQPVKIYTDPSLEVYKKARLTRSKLIAYGPTTWYERVIAFSKGYSNVNQGDNGQMGGSLLVDQEGTIKYYYKNKTVANHSDPNTVVEHIHQFALQQKSKNN